MVLPLVLRTLLIFLTALNITISGYDYRLYLSGANDTQRYLFMAFETGDLNGDGKPDVVFTNPRESVAGVKTGAVYVYFGKENQDFSAYDLKITGATNNCSFGQYVKLTDVNHDGFDDLVIGAPRTDNTFDAPNILDCGAAYVVCGRASFTSRDNAIDNIYNIRVYGPATKARFAQSGSLNNGDVNKDGYMDILIGAPGTDAEPLGNVYLLLGNNLVTSSSHISYNFATTKAYSVLFYPNPRAGRKIGQAASLSFGDLDADGYADVIIGDPLYDPSGISNAGAVWIKYCSSTFPGTTLDQSVIIESGMDGSWTGETGNDVLGSSVYSADIDGDGRPDLLLGAPTQTSNGQVYGIKNTGAKISGARALTNSANYDVKYLGQNSYERLGLIQTAFDVNRDSKADLFLGTARINPATNQYLGRIYLVNGAGVFAGDKTKLISNNSNYLMRFDETCPEESTTIPDIDYLLYLSLAADINNDGLQDLFLSDGSDYGGHCFVILGRVPSVTLTAPNGGENYTAGETHNITWTMTATATLPADADPISLEYSTDGGTTYTSIAAGQPNTGTYAWSVPAVNSTTARVRVTGANVLKNTATDASDANFTIVSTNPAVSVLAPNGGEAWPSGSLQSIKWSADGGPAGLAANPISIYLSLDSGATFATRIAEGLANTGTYDWTVPSGLDVGTARIKITALNNLGINGVGVSTRDFAITTTTGGSDVRVLEIKSGPSPFSPGGSSGMGARTVSTAQIDYKLSSTANVSIYIFDSTGGLMWKKDLTAGAEGAHVGLNSVPWNGADSGGNLLPNGVYIIKVVTGGKVIGTDKIMIIK